MTTPRWMHGHPITDPADALKMFTDPNVKAILAALADSDDGERTAKELKAACPEGISQPMASQYLACLANHGIVTYRKDGRFHRYRLVPGGLTGPTRLLEALMDSLTRWDCAAYDPVLRKAFGEAS